MPVRLGKVEREGGRERYVAASRLDTLNQCNESEHHRIVGMTHSYVDECSTLHKANLHSIASCSCDYSCKCGFKLLSQQAMEITDSKCEGWGLSHSNYFLPHI